jgi:hypothetical protein
MPCYYGLGINTIITQQPTTTSQEGGAVPEARPLCRVSGAVMIKIFYYNSTPIIYRKALNSKGILQNYEIRVDSVRDFAAI